MLPQRLIQHGFTRVVHYSSAELKVTINQSSPDVRDPTKSYIRLLSYGTDYLLYGELPEQCNNFRLKSSVVSLKQIKKQSDLGRSNLFM